jgi:hypothetical protein
MTNQNIQNEEPLPVATGKLEKSLTIPSRRLSGSARCLNCGTPLNGPFCYYCGQPDKNFMRFFPVLLREFMEDFLEFDSRFMRTMKPLLFIPGKLTRDYLDGKRFRYTPPLRLYIFSSMAFFILAAMLAGNAITFNGGDFPDSKSRVGIHITTSDEEELEQVRKALEQVSPRLAKQVEMVTMEEVEALESQAADETEEGGKSHRFTVNVGDEAEDEDEDDTISFNEDPWDKETNPLIIPLMPKFVNDWVNDEIEESPQKGKEIEANPNLIIDKIFEVLPVTMFILLPLAAFLFKFWYLFAGKYYIEHLILALHNHSFLFVVLLISLILNSLAGWQEPAEEGPVTTTVFWANIVIFTWIPLYFLFSLKRVYQQGWTMTFAKYLVISLSYLILLILTASIAALLSFVLL